LKIVTIKIEQLDPAAYNPRRDLQPGDPEYEKLKKSILEFDYIDPIIWNQRTGRVVGGHQRLKILQELGYSEIEVSVVDLPEDKEKALNLALNKISGDWDLPKLKDLLQELDNGDFDIELTGFDENEIEKLMLEFYVPEDVQDDNFDAEAEAEKIIEPTTQPGDIWQLGQHRLMCGDSTNRDDVLQLMDGKMAHVVFTDPPYNVDYGNHNNPRWGNHRKIENDNLSEADWNKFVEGWIKNVLSIAGGAIYICMSCKEWPNVQGSFVRLGGHWSTTIIWAKDRFVLGRSDYHRQYEPILYGWTESNKHFWCGDRTQGDVWRIDRPGSSPLHPTMKPVELVGRAINNSSKPGDIIADLFGGSGTTIIAAEQTKRICYMNELDPIYCDVIVKRYEEYTGLKATKL